MIAGHIGRLVLFSVVAVAGSVVLSGLALFFSGSQAPSPRQALWGGPC